MSVSVVDKFLDLLEDCECTDDDELFVQIQAICEELPHSNFWTGATRYVVGFDDLPYVFKIPRPECSMDYCKMEIEKYEKAKAFKIERILLPIEYVTTTANGLSIYKQAKAEDTLGEMSYTEYKRIVAKEHGLRRSRTVHKIYSSCYSVISEVWLARGLQLYGKKFMKAFTKWTNDCQVNDLHSGNIGFIKGKPIIFDYVGFYE
jgi:hypothetical protein